MRIPSKCLRACLRARVVISTHLVLGGRRLSLPLASQNRQKKQRTTKQINSQTQQPLTARLQVETKIWKNSDQ